MVLRARRELNCCWFAFLTVTGFIYNIFVKRKTSAVYFRITKRGNYHNASALISKGYVDSVGRLERKTFDESEQADALTEVLTVIRTVQK